MKTDAVLQAQCSTVLPPNTWTIGSAAYIISCSFAGAGFNSLKVVQPYPAKLILLLPNHNHTTGVMVLFCYKLISMRFGSSGIPS